MNYELIRVWLAHGDGGERGTGPIIGICDCSVHATTIAKGKAWYGGDGVVREAKAVKITDGGEVVVFLLNDSFRQPVELNVNLPERTKELKKQAMDKLTDFEIELLGLKK